MRFAPRVLGLLLAVSACSFPPPPDVGEDGGDTIIDASMVDAPIDAMPGDARLDTDEGDHDFSDVSVGQTSAVLSVIVQNSGDAVSGALAVSVEGANAGDFEIVPTGDDNDCDGAILESQQSCRAQVRFHPTTSGARAGTLRVEAQPGGAVTVGLSGNGLSPGSLEITSGATLSFGDVEITGQSTVDTIVVRNNGQTATASLTVALGDPSNFTKVTDSCSGSPLDAGLTCQIAVRFNPIEVGVLPTQVSIRESASVGVSASATGTGTARLQVSRTGGGAIASNPSGISCGAGCPSATASFSQTPVTLTATPDAGYVFDGWTGACVAQNPANVCSVALTTPLTQTAAAFQQVFTLNVATTGTGTVTGTGISCGSDCTETYDAGTNLMLTAEPGTGYEVYAWSGTGTACGAGVRMCPVTMDQARSVTVEFRRQYTVSIDKIGSGSGTVSGTGFNCGSTCSALIFAGSSVSLSESVGSAGAGSRNVFDGWSGPCSGSGVTCGFTVSADTTVAAEFTLQHQLAVTLAGTGSGTVTSTPSAINCPGTCSAYFDANSTVSLSQTPSSSTFAGYSGACSGATCGPTMDAPKDVTATFTAWECTPDTIVCNDGTSTYVDCSSTGTIELQMTCPLGCASGAEKCLDIDPSNGLAAQLDLAPDGPDVAFAGTSSINTSTGAVLNGPTSIVVPNATVNGIRVFRFKSLSIAGTLKVSGSAPLALVVDGDVAITGTLDVSADGTTSGPGIRSTATTCDGGNGTGANNSSTSPGGGGAGRYQNAFKGGDAEGIAGGTGGAVLSDADIVPLQGGCKGGKAIAVENNIAYAAQGGGGGGSVQIVSRTQISITGSGKIDASGGGGQTGIAATGWIGGGGGGSGGGVLLEAPQVVLDGANVVISTKGGGGAGGGGGAVAGSDGGTASGAASGGTAPSAGAGGAGGTETLAPGSGANHNSSGGGGGGSVGQARFNTSAGVISPQNGAAIRSRQTTAVITSRQVP
jgi:hypothetical protein